MTALILGVFASSWFGWAQERPPERWRGLLIAGALLSVTIAGVGGYLAWSNWSASSALNESSSMTRFIIIFWSEVLLIAVGSGVLAWKRQSAWIACWTALIVGIHFLPLGPIFEEPGFYVLGAAMMIGAIGAWSVARQSSIAPSAITGIATGSVLLIFAGWNVVRTLA